MVQPDRILCIYRLTQDRQKGEEQWYFHIIWQNAKENGEIRDIDTGMISTVIFSSLRSIVYKMLKEGREDEYDNAISQIITLVINGIKNNF